MASTNSKIKERNGIIFILFHIFVTSKRNLATLLRILKFTATPSLKSLLLNLSREFVSRYWKKSISLRLSMRMYSTSTITGSNRFRSWGSCSFCSVEFAVLSKSPWVTLTPFLSNNSFMNIINCSSTEIPLSEKKHGWKCALKLNVLFPLN